MDQRPQQAPPGKPQRGPYVFTCEAGHKYAYCMCRQSARYPLCDGTHRSLSEDVGPIKLIPEQAGRLAFCACGTSKNKPHCDGSHQRLAEP